jgi:hypothetical protein
MTRHRRLQARGQALLEFAIFGTLALTALAFLIQLGLRANYQQEVEQQTFRRALRIAKGEDEVESQAVQVLQFRDRQIPDPSMAFSIMPRTLSQAGASVTWAEHLTALDDKDERSEPLIVFRVNQTERNYRAKDFQSAGRSPVLIDREMTSAGTITQTGVEGSGAKAAESVTTGQTTTITLNGKSVSSTLNTNATFNW